MFNQWADKQSSTLSDRIENEENIQKYKCVFLVIICTLKSLENATHLIDFIHGLYIYHVKP